MIATQETTQITYMIHLCALALAAVAGEQLVSIPSPEFTERAAIIVPPPRTGYAGVLLLLRRLVLEFRAAADGIRRADTAGFSGGVPARPPSRDRPPVAPQDCLDGLLAGRFP